MSYLEGGVSSKLKILALVPDVFGRGEVDATCASPAAFPTKLGDVTVALSQKTTLPAHPGRTDKVSTSGRLLEAPADNKNEGM